MFNSKLVVFLQLYLQFFHIILMCDFIASYWIKSECHVDGDVWLSPKHQLVRREHNSVIFGYIACMNQRMYMITPIDFVLFLESS